MSVFDRSHFNRMTGGDRGLQREVLGLFRAQVESWTAALQSDAAWRTAAHTLKGSARGIGFHALAAACEAAEAASESNRPAALARVRAALAESLVALEQFAADAAVRLSR